MKSSLTTKDVEKIIKLKDNDGTARIKVIFTNEVAKSKAFSKKRNLKETNIGLSDDLTQYRSKLAYLARSAAKKDKELRTWTFRGNIYMRKTEQGDAKLIHTIEELAEYIGINPDEL